MTDTDHEGSVLVLRISGDLDAATCDEPVDVLAAALPTDATGLVVDLGGVTFLDSSGLGCLVRIRTLAHDAALPLTLRAVDTRVSRLLRVSGLDRVFDVKSVSDPSPPGADTVGTA